MDGSVEGTDGSPRVTEEGCTNNRFSSEAQSGEHTNSLRCEAQCVSVCVCVCNPGIPCQTYSLSEKVNTVKKLCVHRDAPHCGLMLWRCKGQLQSC